MRTFPLTGTATRILLVDHDTPSRESTGGMLRTHGFQTSTANNRHEALGVIRENPVELAIVNISLPGAEGIATILAILAFAPAMKIIAISGGPAAGAGDLLPLAKSLGAAAIPGNPLDHGNLLGAIHDLLAPGLRQLAS